MKTPLTSLGFEANSSERTLAIFRRLIEKTCAYANSAGLKVVAGNSESWAHFQNLPFQRRDAAMKAAMTYHDICQAAITAGWPLSDSRMLLWASLRHFDLIPSSDLLSHVTDDIVVEVYTSDGIQLFRNMKFMELCSYTLADIFMYPWWELFERNDDLIADIGKEVTAVLSGESRKILMSQVRSHRLVEAFSQERCVVEMTFKNFSPVFTKGDPKPVGFVCTSTATLLERRPLISSISRRPYEPML